MPTKFVAPPIMVGNTFSPLIGSTLFMEPERSSTSSTRVSERVACAEEATVVWSRLKIRMKSKGTSTVAETLIVDLPATAEEEMVGFRFRVFHQAVGKFTFKNGPGKLGLHEVTHGAVDSQTDYGKQKERNHGHQQDHGGPFFPLFTIETLAHSVFLPGLNQKNPNEYATALDTNGGMLKPVEAASAR
jgi:hypothetical protein